MSSLDFLNEFINPARQQAGQSLHKNSAFIRKVEDEIDDLGAVKIIDRFNNDVRTYQLTHDQMLLVGMRESKSVRKIVLKKLNEMEQKQAPKIPTNFAEALQLAADQAKALELAAPKVAFVDNFVETGTTKTLRETAKILNYPERKMIALMIDHDILYRMSGKLLPYQKYHEQKLFEVKTGERNGHAFTQTRVTTKGLAWLGERYASDLMEDK